MAERGTLGRHASMAGPPPATAKSPTTPSTPAAAPSGGLFSRFTKKQSVTEKGLITLAGHEFTRNFSAYGFDVRETYDARNKENVLVVVNVAVGSFAHRAGLLPGMVLRALIFTDGGRDTRLALHMVSELILALQRAGPNPKLKVDVSQELLLQAENEEREESSGPAPAPRDFSVPAGAGFESMGGLGASLLAPPGGGIPEDDGEAYEDGYIAQSQLNSHRPPSDLDRESNSFSGGAGGVGGQGNTTGLAPLASDEGAPVPLDDNDYVSFFKGELNEAPPLFRRPGEGEMSPSAATAAAASTRPAVRSASQYGQNLPPSPAVAAPTSPTGGGVKWYAPTASAIDAENVLRPAPDGAFMVRSSISKPGTYALAVKNAGAVEHMSINVTPTGQFYLSKTKVFASLPEMIEFYMKESLESHFKRVKTCLAYPMGTATFH